MMLLMLIIIFTLAAYAFLTYNRLSTQIHTILAQQKKITEQLDRRFKSFEMLLQEVKQFIDTEQTVLKDILQLRNLSQLAKTKSDEQTYIEAENQISAILENLGILFDQYPDLKINARCTQLRLDISKTENKLAYAKQAYNDSLEIYAVNKVAFPATLLITAFRDTLEKEFLPWQTKPEQSNLSEQISYSVQL